MGKLTSSSLKFIRTNFIKHPVLSNGIIYGTMFFAAEYSQQLLGKKFLTDKPTDLDVPTLIRNGVYGTCLQGPILTIWFRWLDNTFSGTKVATVVKKLAVDQFICVPPLLGIFYLSMSIMEWKQDIFAELREKFIQTYTYSCMFWIPAQSINFFLVPPIYRIIYISVVSFAWVNILCYVKRQMVAT